MHTYKRIRYKSPLSAMFFFRLLSACNNKGNTPISPDNTNATRKDAQKLAQQLLIDDGTLLHGHRQGTMENHSFWYARRRMSVYKRMEMHL